MLFAVAAGAIGDLVDRRRFLLVAQGLMLVAAVALGALALAGLVTPWTLLALIFALGIGAALTAPTWQTLQPELVSPQERPQAISLGSVSQNLARAIGPAIGGVILAATSAGTVFLVNAVTFLAVIGVVAAWRSHRPPATLPREHIGDAIRAGGRYVAASPALRVILLRAFLLRAFLFIFFASSIWALLPLTAKAALHLGSGGYGLLLGCVGVGAVAGALVLPKLRTLLPAGGQLTAGSLCLAARVGLTATLVTAAVAPRPRPAGWAAVPVPADTARHPAARRRLAAPAGPARPWRRQSRGRWAGDGHRGVPACVPGCARICSPPCGTPGSAGAAPAPAPGGSGRTPPTRTASWSSSSSPPGTSTCASTSGSPAATPGASPRSAP